MTVEPSGWIFAWVTVPLRENPEYDFAFAFVLVSVVPVLFSVSISYPPQIFSF